jgi:hypothetical protein
VRRKFAWYRRWSTYAYRLKNEAARLAYGLRQSALERKAA